MRLTLGLALIGFISATSHSTDSCDVAGFFLEIIHMNNLKNLIAEMETIRNEIHDRLSASELAKFDEIIDRLNKLSKSHEESDLKGFASKALLIIGSMVAKDFISNALKKLIWNE